MNSNQKQNIQYFLTSNSIALKNCSERLFHMLNPKFQSDLFSDNSRQQALIKFLCCVFVWKIERCCVFRLSCTQINTVIFQAKIWCRHNGHFQIQTQQCFKFLAFVIGEQIIDSFGLDGHYTCTWSITTYRHVHVSGHALSKYFGTYVKQTICWFAFTFVTDIDIYLNRLAFP